MRLFYLLLLVLVPECLRAQPVAPAQFRFEHLTVNEGLAHSDAMTVAQDTAGFIWVGTNRGLDRYDGYSLRHYLLPFTPTGMPGNRIKVVHCSPTGQLWVGAERAGLSYYNPTTDRLVTLLELAKSTVAPALLQQLAGVSVMALASDRAGYLWVATRNAGLYRLRLNKTGQLTEFTHVPFADVAAGPQPILSSLATDAEGDVWIGTYDRGLWVVRQGNGATVAEATSLTEPVRVLLLDRHDDLWVGLEQQVRWVPAANRRPGRALNSYVQIQQYPQLQALQLDSFGRLWVGTIYGLYVWEAGPATGLAPPLRGVPTRLLPVAGAPNSLNSERVHQLFEDRTQIMWLCASSGGLNRVNLRQKPFSWLYREMGDQPTLPNNYINALYKEDATNTLWLATRNGIAAYDLTQNRYRTYLVSDPDHPAASSDVLAICQARDGTLWFGARPQGLVSLRRRGGREVLTTYGKLPGDQSIVGASIACITEDETGSLWVATYDRGLYCFSAEGRLRGHYQAGQHGLLTNSFTFVLYDAGRQVLWASTHDQGLLQLQVGSPDSLRVLRQFRYQPGVADGLRSNFVWPLLLDRQGILWIGTIGGGLHHLAPDEQGLDVVQSDQRFLPESDVESLLADDSGAIWTGGTGLYRYQPTSRQYVHYDVADGLQSNSFKVGAATHGTDGTLYFGGINGVSYFQPAAIHPNPYPPVVQLTGLRLNNQPVTVGQLVNGRVLLSRPLSEPQQLVLAPSETDFSVEFVGLNYANPQKTRYAYRLEGYQSGWVAPLPGQRTASFANLPPGRYTLRVKASNGEGEWSAPVAPLRIEILAPWYKTGWAYLLYAAVALGGVMLYRRVEMGQQQLKNKLALEQAQAEQHEELANLKLAFFTNISHELRTPLTLIMGPVAEIMASPGPVPDLHLKMGLVHRQSRKLLELVNQLLDFRKVETGHVPLRARLADLRPWLSEQYAAFALEPRTQGVAYVLTMPAYPLRLYFDDSKLEIILTNLLANAFKYVGDQGRVELGAALVGQPDGEAVYVDDQLVDNYVKITVGDTGSGIAASELGRIFDPYYQASHTNALRTTGTGIGLALARQFAQRHGGQLTVASTPGVGSTFELRLPLGRQHLHPEDIQPEDAKEIAPPLTETAGLVPQDQPELVTAQPVYLPLLLVVEDHEEVRTYLRQLFEGSYEVLTAEDGVAGWEAALAQLPDLIISDVMMPHSDGLELCQKIKHHPKTSHIPVLLLTARTAETHQLEGLNVGADDYVRKPFNPLVLQARAEALLRNRRKVSEYYQRQILLQPTEMTVADADREFLAKAMSLVEKHLGNTEFNVQVLINDMAMSQSAFYRRLKALTGQTVVEFIRDVRLRRAAQLLASGQLLVSEVASEVGIDNTRYFSRTFQKLFNQTPSEYARQHRTNSAQASSQT